MATINTFIEPNKIKLASKIHIGKKTCCCPKYKIHKDKLTQSHSDNYLGDVISAKRTLDETIKKN